MIWIILIAVLLIILLVLFLTPIRIIINTEEEEFIKGRYGFIMVGVRTESESILSVTLYLPFTHFKLYPSKVSETKAKRVRGKRGTSGEHKPFNPTRIRLLIRTVWQVAAKFKVKRIILDVDTSNVAVNANLFPLFALMSDGRRVDLRVNYAGNFSMELDVHNNLWNISGAVIRNYFKR